MLAATDYRVTQGHLERLIRIVEETIHSYPSDWPQNRYITGPTFFLRVVGRLWSANDDPTRPHLHIVWSADTQTVVCYLDNETYPSLSFQTTAIRNWFPPTT